MFSRKNLKLLVIWDLLEDNFISSTKMFYNLCRLGLMSFFYLISQLTALSQNPRYNDSIYSQRFCH